jgi:hypothetical protein
MSFTYLQSLFDGDAIFASSLQMTQEDVEYLRLTAVTAPRIASM